MDSHGDLAATTGQKCTVNVYPQKWNMEGGESVGQELAVAQIMTSLLPNSDLN